MERPPGRFPQFVSCFLQCVALSSDLSSECTYYYHSCNKTLTYQVAGLLLMLVLDKIFNKSIDTHQHRSVYSAVNSGLDILDIKTTDTWWRIHTMRSIASAVCIYIYLRQSKDSISFVLFVLLLCSFTICDTSPWWSFHKAILALLSS